MIPKIIHYCWVGGTELPEQAQKCIDSWKKYCPDYEIIRWDESNYDFSKNQYMKHAYDEKKWGFVPDYARLDIIYEYGGVYLDTDVEIVKSFDDLLKQKMFVGFESGSHIALGLGFGAEKGNGLVKALLQQYNQLDFYLSDGGLNLTPSPVFQTEVLISHGLVLNNKMQVLDDECLVLPKVYLNPMDISTGEIKTTEETYSIHHYAGSWISEKNRFHQKVYRALSRHFGDKTATVIKQLYRKIKK